jgi:hypothetical protein
MYYYILDILTGTPLTEMVYVPDTVGIPFSNRVIKFNNIKEAKAWMKKKSKCLSSDMSKYEVVWNPHKD